MQRMAKLQVPRVAAQQFNPPPPGPRFAYVPLPHGITFCVQCCYELDAENVLDNVQPWPLTVTQLFTFQIAIIAHDRADLLHTHADTATAFTSTWHSPSVE
jgi:predicted component of type VI protein secretion system